MYQSIEVVEEEENDDVQRENLASFPTQSSISKTAEKDCGFRLYGTCSYDATVRFAIRTTVKSAVQTGSDYECE